MAPADWRRVGGELLGIDHGPHPGAIHEQRTGDVAGVAAITGLPDGERIAGIEVLEPEGIFVGVSAAGRFYALDRVTGAATILNPGAPAVPLTGTAFGMRDLQVVSNNGSTLQGRHDWTAEPGPTLTPPAHVVAWAWSHHNALPPVVTLDSTTDALYRPGYGTSPQILIGPLNVDTSDEAGLDAGPHDGQLYAALTVNGSPGLYAIDSTTGNATLMGAVASAPITSLAIDFQAAPRLEPPSATVVEANTPLTFTVRRRGDTTVAAQYLVETKPGFQGATPGQDYVEKSELLDFTAGESEKTIVVTILDDALRESRESFQVTVRENPATKFSTSTSITILDDENQPPILTVTSPAMPAYVSADAVTVQVTGTVTDDTDGFQVILWLGDSWVRATSSPWSFDVKLLVPGRNNFHTIEVIDAQGERMSIPVDIWRAADHTSYFAEGATGTFFDTDLAFANPHPVDIPVTLEFLRDDGTVVPHTLTLGPERRSTLNVETIPGLEATTTAAVVHTPYPIVAERTMRWGATGYGAHTEKASRGLRTLWYFAEGSQGFFFTYLQLVNPHATDNPVTVRFLREGEPPVTKTFPLGPHARLTVDAGTIPELQDRAFGMEVQFTTPGLAERAMYFGLDPFWKAGHGSAGGGLATSWFLAEGATGPFFETFVLVANPSSEPADVTMTFFPENGLPVTRTKQVAAGGRLTVNIEQEDPSLANAAVATGVRSTVPVVVERAQYWPWSPDQWYEAHGSFGLTGEPSQHYHWGLAEGRVGGPEGYQSFILLANEYSVPVTATIRFLRESGAPVIKQFTVEPESRLTIEVGSQVPELANEAFGADITSTFPIWVERAMYASPGGVIWSAGTSASGTPLR